jgi:ABC-type transport system substrate-binding protein
MNLPRLTYCILICVISLSLVLFPDYARQAEKEKKESMPAGPIRHGGIYRVPINNDPATLDPAYVQDRYGVTVVHQIFDGLVRFDPYLTVLPALAETWQVEDQGKTYRFVLRKNAYFHNGKPVTVEDVVFSISRLLQVNPPPAILPHLIKIIGAQDYRSHKKDYIEGLEPISDRVLLVKLEEPHTPFLTALGMYQAKIIPKAEVIRLADRFGQNPVGSGPFRFVSWQENKLIRLERFSDYYAGTSFLDEINYIVYSGEKIEQALGDFISGKLEEMPVYGNIRQELSTHQNLQWIHRPSLSLFFYGMNCNHPLLNNTDFRKALALAVDRQKLVAQFYKNQFEIAKTILPPGMPGYHRQDQMALDDLSLARDHFKRAMEEYKGSLPTLEIVSASQSSFAKAELNYVRERWEQLGIQLKIKYITDWTKFKTYLKSESTQIYRYAWFADMPDPDSFLYPLFASDSPVNFMHYKSKDVDQMLLTARRIVDPVERAEMYRRIEALVLKSSPLIPLFYLSIDRVYQPTVQGVQVSALGAHTMSYHRVWLKAPSSN